MVAKPHCSQCDGTGVTEREVPGGVEDILRARRPMARTNVAFASEKMAAPQTNFIADQSRNMGPASVST